METEAPVKPVCDVLSLCVVRVHGNVQPHYSVVRLARVWDNCEVISHNYFVNDMV